ncbi:FtsB family cell division protein [Bacillus xiapuensis]|uniref:FtsB family cell division protein n=1 Tax=Bacillus xiapuensis TaxID=2014075 RepID=UPI000C242696|nr:septum formation initiator family protein [Bacillus xiapuensis]
MSGLNKEKVTALKNAFVFSREKQERFLARHRTKLFRRLAAFAILASIIVGLLGSTLYSQNAHLEEKKQQKEQALASLSDLKKQQKQYEEELKKLNNDEYIAELARKNYFFSDKGEVIFNIPESDKKVREPKE